ncbi:hypothetical protein TrVFT333_008958 [Trichoderma virens FT-333]|nr:hypothetical protein TrVFT333_008958 [Trichoderma virens FT-333]
MRSRRLPLVAAPFIVLLLLGSLYIGRDRLSWFPSSQRRPIPYKQLSKEVIHNGSILPAETISEYLETIYNVKQFPTLENLECPAINVTRYKSLNSILINISISIVVSTSVFIASFISVYILTLIFSSSVTGISIFISPRIFSIITIQYSCFSSSFTLTHKARRRRDPLLLRSRLEELHRPTPSGRLPDGTGDVLAALRPSLEALGVTYIYNSSTVHSAEGNRIAKLAALRNMPLEPIYQKTLPISDDASVIFLNDVAACPEDILELLLQKKDLNADMTCAMDWTYSGDDPTFYDVWIARGMNGDSFFHIPASGNWGEAHNLFWNAPDTKSRFEQLRPFQAFACWNGATVFSAQPIAEGLRFRTNYDKTGECFQGEPVLFCKDMWWRGYGKIAVVPSVNLEYSVKNGRRLKQLKGFVSDNVVNHDARSDRIEWAGPPDTVRCMPTWKDQFFQRWNKSLTP